MLKQKYRNNNFNLKQSSSNENQQRFRQLPYDSLPKYYTEIGEG